MAEKERNDANTGKSEGKQGNGKRILLRTFGCQMNIRDSEVIQGLLLENEFGVTDVEEKADAVLFVTCSVRQHAEDKVWSEIGRIAKGRGQSPLALSKAEGSGTIPVIGLIGCMAENYKEKAFKRMPGIDLVVGTNNIGEIPSLLKEIFNKPSTEHRTPKILSVSKKERDEFVYEANWRQDKDNCFVVISEGCDNFCSYCVVPYVRGRLRHRKPENIIREIELNIKNGIKAITLLGQNVNAYQFNGVDFVKLLELVNSLRGLEEFSFVTSHPKDASIRLFEAMAGLDKLKKYLHLPFQSGSNRILGLMKRGYTREHYLLLAEQYRKTVPQGELTTDIIVGFPTESREDFERTLELAKEVRFNAAFIFKYSPRMRAEAGKLTDDVLKEVKEDRHGILLEAQKNISRGLKAKR